MKKINVIYSTICLALMSLLFFTGCDDGRIYPDELGEAEGGKATMRVVFKGQEAWPSAYMLVFAAFGEDEGMPVVSKIISQPSKENAEVAVTLNGLSEGIKKVSIAVTNKGRELVYAYYTFPIDDPSQEVTLPISEINLASYDRIQNQVFDSYCIRCHGAGNQAAANLNLTKDYSPESLINVPSALSGKGELLVTPQQADESFLVKVLKEDVIQYNHMDVLPEAELVTLIETWVNKSIED
ncbi:cytochrome c [Parabacteroides sp. OttesenSCG-928-G07]|nr:cytochrome c [Parabacteroides sp. OttesenSCG-928-G21]MDL2278478.1 cytochrome c [Parabacteroides sp. OttesenSCG-928-G07]